MKRNMVLILALLEHLETHATGRPMAIPSVEGYAPDLVAYHVRLCEEAGYIAREGMFPVDLTWQGHEALDRLRNTGCRPGLTR